MFKELMENTFEREKTGMMAIFFQIENINKEIVKF